MQQCYIVRQSYTYGENGDRINPGRVWDFVENIEDTSFDFGIMPRQQFIEKTIRIRLEAAGVKLHSPCKCVNIEKTDEPDADGYYITATLRDMTTREEYTVKSAYLMGADGGRSFVRRHLGVEFEGNTTQDKWIRVDGRVITNLPTPRNYGSIQSANHGNVLWEPLDHGATRIGFVFTEEQERRCNGNLTEEELNTGIHDAVNIGWKLALVVKGKAKPTLLETYSIERRAAAQGLIAFDRKFSTLMPNKWPEDMHKVSYEDINAALADLFDEAQGYNTGLKIAYEPNLVNVVPAKDYTSICVGARAPDAGLFKPGLTAVSTTLNSAGHFRSFFSDTAKLDTIVSADPKLSAEEGLGVPAFGTVYMDDKRQAHSRYGVNLRYGSLVLRLDGHLWFAAELSVAGLEAVKMYLGKFIISKMGIQQKTY
ncbi:Monooxygenase FAD-binding [Penicillium hordei]|uniref:Monooxygenase FAD-binding n=1 Tax=Penicillium hordei TaxID=40994 RepID=A0AAD6DYW2_9EURO|nr:Monooxygenase FAD-binding [Penicillium hordei]KAJ5597585.1 Monooxygenase FAD-binding [Penicillium hordei]